MSPGSRAIRRSGAVAVALALLLGLVACTTVPSSSSPQAVGSVAVQPSGEPVPPGPEPGADPRSIVSAFLAANGAADDNHNAARAYLTPEARTRWTDDAVTVVDTTHIGNLTSDHTVSVTGQLIGTIGVDGTYTPGLSGDGTGAGGLTESPTFGLTQVNKQWRIDSLPAGLLITESQFAAYTQRQVFFFDLAEQHLVPEFRYTQLLDPAALAQWLVGRLSVGPQEAAFTTELPAPTTSKPITVTVPGDGTDNGGLTRVEIPGAAESDGPHLTRLAAQVAATLAQVAGVDSIQITDGGHPVAIPGIGSDGFTSGQVTTDYQPRLVSPQLFYVDSDGGVRAADGTPLPGKIGSGAYTLKSVALADYGGLNGLSVAGVNVVGGVQQLDIGSVSKGLTTTAVRGKLSRPEWSPTSDEVWIGEGTAVYRVVPGSAPALVPVSTAGGKSIGQVSALRLSPDGSRVAMVLTNPDGSAQVWVGSIIRTSQAVRVDGLSPITPQGVVVTDAAWNDEGRLFAIGHNAQTNVAGVYEVQADGSQWIDHGIGNLPPTPDSITVTVNQVAAVSSDDTVWKQRAGQWISVNGDETRGTNPVYVS